MIEIVIHQVQATVAPGNDGVKHLMLADPETGITVRAAFPAEAAAHLGELLADSGIVIAPATALKGGI